VGKTQLALTVAHEVRDRFPDGAVFVDYAPLRDPAFALPTLANRLNIRPIPRQPMLDTLAYHLRDAHRLLLLDNLEGIVSVAPAICELLVRCPKVKVLATSRAALRVSLERAFPVMPLAVPDLLRPPNPDAINKSPAAALFVARCRAVQPDFALTPDNARSIAEICVRLDGLPLAIELAAARARLLPPESILNHLQSRLDLLTEGPRDAPLRHQTLRGAIAWSYVLLDPAERALFRRLAVFVGSFTLQDAHAVQDEPLKDGPGLLSQLSSLIDKSLVVRIPGDGEPRFRMLETIRDYGLEQLAATNELNVVRRRHAAYLREFAEQAEPQLIGGPLQSAWLGRCEAKYDNLRVALEWTTSQAHADNEALRIAAALWPFWQMHGDWQEGRKWLNAALARSRSPTPARAKALIGAGHLATDQADYAAADQLYTEALDIYRHVGDARGAGDALIALGGPAWKRGDFPTAHARFEEGLQSHRQVGYKPGIAMALKCLGIVTGEQKQYDAGRSFYLQAADLYKEIGDKRGLASVLNNVGMVEYWRERYGEAHRLFSESITLQREVGNRRGIAITLVNLGHTNRRLGEPSTARAAYAEALGMQRALGDPREIAELLEGVAQLLKLESAPERAATLFGAASGLRDAIGAPPVPAMQPENEQALKAIRAALREVRFTSAWDRGRQMTFQQALEYVTACLEEGQPVSRPARGAAFHPLTRQEQRIAALVAVGYTNAQIAKELWISVRTVTTHVQHILDKLGFHRRVQIATWAKEHGLKAPTD
jgi:non-specific serine/threonine protein kinase